MAIHVGISSKVRSELEQRNHLRLYMDRNNATAAQFQLHVEEDASDGTTGDSALTETARSNLLLEMALARGHEEEVAICRHYRVCPVSGRNILMTFNRRKLRHGGFVSMQDYASA